MSAIRRAFTEDFTIYRVAELKPVLLAVIQHKDSLRRRIQLARLSGEHGGRRRG